MIKLLQLMINHLIFYSIGSLHQFANCPFLLLFCFTGGKTNWPEKKSVQCICDFYLIFLQYIKKTIVSQNTGMV